MVDCLLTQIETNKKIKNKIGIECLIETALGMSNIKEIAKSSSRLEALHFGVADYAASLRARTVVIGGLNPDYPGDQWHHGLSQLAMTCRAYGLRAIDGPFGDFNDSESYIASAKRADMRLISIVLNSSSEKSRLQDTRRLLDYGFKYYQTKKIIAKFQPVSIVDVWGGVDNKLELGPKEDVYITLTKPTFDRLSFEASKNLGVKAPVMKDSVIDRLDIKVDGRVINSVNLVAVTNVKRKGFIMATIESFMFFVYSFFMQDEIN